MGEVMIFADAGKLGVDLAPNRCFLGRRSVLCSPRQSVSGMICVVDGIAATGQRKITLGKPLAFLCGQFCHALALLFPHPLDLFRYALDQSALRSLLVKRRLDLLIALLSLRYVIILASRKGVFRLSVSWLEG